MPYEVGMQCRAREKGVNVIRFAMRKDMESLRKPIRPSGYRQCPHSAHFNLVGDNGLIYQPRAALDYVFSCPRSARSKSLCPKSSQVHRFDTSGTRCDDSGSKSYTSSHTISPSRPQSIKPAF